MRKKFFNIIVLTISLTALAFSFIKVIPFSVSSDTYIGTIATFIGVSVTLLIGFQIFNYLELRKELTKLKRSKKEIKKTKKNISKLEHEVQESLDIITAKFASGEQEKCVHAFLLQQKALISSLKTERKDFQNIFSGLKEYKKGIHTGYFATGNIAEVEKKVDDYIKISKKYDSKIKKLKNYHIIKYEYEHIMNCFYTRLENAKQNNDLKQEKIEEIMGKK